MTGVRPVPPVRRGPGLAEALAREAGEVAEWSGDLIGPAALVPVRYLVLEPGVGELREATEAEIKRVVGGSTTKLGPMREVADRGYWATRVTYAKAVDLRKRDIIESVALRGSRHRERFYCVWINGGVDGGMINFKKVGARALLAALIEGESDQHGRDGQAGA